MAHGELICRDCFTELDVRNVSDQPRTEFACPNCGSTSFGI